MDCRKRQQSHRELGRCGIPRRQGGGDQPWRVPGERRSGSREGRSRPASREASNLPEVGDLPSSGERVSRMATPRCRCGPAQIATQHSRQRRDLTTRDWGIAARAPIRERRGASNPSFQRFRELIRQRDSSSRTVPRSSRGCSSVPSAKCSSGSVRIQAAPHAQPEGSCARRRPYSTAGGWIRRSAAIVPRLRFERRGRGSRLIPGSRDFSLVPRWGDSWSLCQA